MRYKIAKFFAYTPFVLYALEFVIKSFEFGIFVWFALIVLSVGRAFVFCACVGEQGMPIFLESVLFLAPAF